ncbi:MAG: tRNA guanosine(34) transglycosylase Tgt [Planctomycetota bacterium]|nr:tRNA guanosine(34) transglycosylase Tgt [Planctomycetota bacterium]
MTEALKFDISMRSSSTRARLGRVTTCHGSFDTPAFMPVGTKGTIKGILPGLVQQTGAQIVLNNTYHLLLRPGPDLVARQGGVHKFMNWCGPILTDSGGYQAYSLAAMNAVDDDGVEFKSIVDGSMIRLTPERATQVQNLLGADIIMAFDDCPPSVDPATEVVNQDRLKAAVSRDAASTMARSATADAAKKPNRKRVYDHAARLDIANERTVRWLQRCKDAHSRPGEQSLFGIVQGGTDLARRSWSVERVCNIELPGYAIGGVAVGETSEQIAHVVRHTAPLMPDAKPRYLMGVGYERDLLAAVLAGVDMFDCVLPTRNGRNANAFTPTGQIRLRNAKYAEDPRPMQEDCDCPACKPSGYGWQNWTDASGTPGVFSRAYIRHLFMADEMLGPILVTLHNLRHFQRFMADIRATIATDDWSGLLARWPVAAMAGSTTDA